jgi:hypothetical protein
MVNFENRVKEVLSTIDNRLDILKVGRVDRNQTTAVIASQTEDLSLSAGTPEILEFNNVEVDLLGEFNNGVFTPKRDGLYNIDIMAEFAVDSDQDELKIDLVDEDISDSILENESRASGSGNTDRELNTTVQLEQGTSYHVEVENVDNDDSINGKPKRTRLVIYCSGIDPEVLTV